MKLADSRQQPFQIRNSSRGLDTSSSSPLLRNSPDCENRRAKLHSIWNRLREVVPFQANFVPTSR